MRPTSAPAIGSEALPSTAARGRFLRFLSRWGRRLARGPVIAAKAFLVLLFTQFWLGSIVIAGWSARFMQRTVLKQWWKRSPRDEARGFAEFLAISRRTDGHLRWPNWLMDQSRPHLPSDARPPLTLLGLIRKGFYSLGLNLKLGFQMIINTWVLTLPPALLWLFSWYDGWNNSFNKGYEQAPVGPLIGITGVFIFIAVMFYLPMAQARQASTRDWRSFYQFKFVWSLARRRTLSCLGLAMAYSLFSIPVMVLLIVPTFFPQMKPSWASLSAPEALQLLKTFYFWSGAVIVAAYIFLRYWAARIYAGALLEGVQRGALVEDQLAEGEWEALHILGLLTLQPIPPRQRWLQALHWVGSRAGRVTIAAATFLVWFTFVAQIYIAQFMNHHPVTGWLNQPLVQLPYFNYIPSALKKAAEGGG